jgi:putative copper export protein
LIDDSVRIALVFVHVLSAAIYVGGTIFLAAVLVPLTRQTPQAPVAARLLRSAARRFSRISWVMLAILVLSGVGLLERNGLLTDGLTSGSFWSSEIGAVLAVKAGAVGALLGLSYVHDFVLGPRLAQALEAMAPAGGRPPPGFAAQRRRLVWLARFNLLLALGVIALGVMLFRGVPG